MITSGRVVGLAVAAVAALAVGVWLARGDDSSGSDGTGARVLPGLATSVNDVRSVTVRKTGDLVTTLNRTDAGWVVAERQYPADTGRLRKLLLDLGSLEVLEPKTRDPKSYAKLGVEDSNSAGARSSRIDVTTSKQSFALLIGRSGGTKDVYVRLVDAPQALLARPQILVEADPRRWIDHAIADIALARVTRVDVTPASGRAYSARRADPKDPFVLDGAKSATAPVVQSDLQAVAESLAGFTSDDVRQITSASIASGSPSLRVQTFDGLDVNVTGRAEGSRFWIRVTAVTRASSTGPAEAAVIQEAATLAARGADHEFEIPAYKYDALFRTI